MAKRERKAASDLAEQASALAEQLGHIAGAMQGTAENWVQRQLLADQLTRVRDGAAQLLESLSERVATGVTSRTDQQNKAAARNPVTRARAADPARAPGKRRRTPAPRRRGVKKSDESIPKLRTARAVRQRRKSHA